MGWLAASEGDSKKSRGEMLRLAGIPAPIPEPPMCAVIRYAIDVGLAQPGGMGPAPVSASELTAWAAGMGVDLAPWEFATVRAMSAAYVAGTSAKRAPWEPTDSRAAVASAVMTLQMRGGQ